MASSVKRKYPRVNLVVQAEIRSPFRNFPYRGQTVTIGEGVCYLTC